MEAKMAGEIFKKVTGKDVDGLEIQEIDKEIEKLTRKPLKLGGTGYPFDIVEKDIET